MFLEKLAEDAYNALREALLTLLRKARDKNRERGEYVTAATINVGDLRLHLEFPGQEEITADELRRRLASAAEYIGQLPDSALSGGASDMYYGLRWDEQSRCWRGRIFTPEGTITAPSTTVDDRPPDDHMG